MAALRRGTSIPELDGGHWQRLASCAAHPADVFFPERGSRDRRPDRIEAAKRVCRGCPVLMPCRTHALHRPELYGVWGAMTAGERIALLAGRAPIGDDAD